MRGKAGKPAAKARIKAKAAAGTGAGSLGDTLETAGRLMAKAIALSLKGMRAGNGGPFGAVVARNGRIVGKGSNQVVASSDPTAHAEVVAIRDACRALKTFQLDGCVLYTSCEPCPMCLAAAYWARVDRIVFANSRVDAARIGFGDDFIYREIPLPAGKRKLPITRLMGKEALAVFREWERKTDKIPYGPDLLD
ncbi:MAG: tRNA-specific adenosine deaminase [Fibrobacteres bacterium]|nr:tRNA-specific adenosine deaminase [Fibrobacterota bacterium]